jgi:ribose transport system substrate-binding protein
MHLNKIHFRLLIMMTVLVSLMCHSANKKEYRVTLVAKAMDSEFWQNVKQGAMDAAAKLPDVKLTVLAPAREINIDQQVNILEDQIMKQVSAIAIAPCGSAEIIPILNKAHTNNIPVISFGSDIEWELKSSYVGTDNRLGGRLAGDYIAKALNAKGNVAVIRGILGIHDHEERVGGFLDAVQGLAGIEIVALQPANSERELALTVMENILTSHPELDAVFITSDQMALGALEAIDAHRLTGKLITVGFDGGREAIQAIREERLTAEVAQNPHNMGRLAFLTAYQAAKGKVVENRIDTGTALIDKSNVDEYYTSDNNRIQR